MFIARTLLNQTMVLDRM